MKELKRSSYTLDKARTIVNSMKSVRKGKKITRKTVPIAKNILKKAMQQIDNYDFLDKKFKKNEVTAIFGLMKLNDPQYITNSTKYHKSDLQTRFLEEIYKVTNFPSTESRIDIAYLLSMPHRSVQVWFQNKRQRTRTVDHNLRDYFYDISLEELIVILLRVCKEF